MRSVILKTTARLLVGMILVFALYLLWRGHHLPGGGFIAALVAAAGFGLFAVAEGREVVCRSLRIDPLTLAAVGLGLALASGLLPLLLNKPFFLGIWWSAGVDLMLGTPLVFDIGVFLAVLGSVLSLLLSLEEG